MLQQKCRACISSIKGTTMIYRLTRGLSTFDAGASFRSTLAGVNYHSRASEADGCRRSMQPTSVTLEHLSTINQTVAATTFRPKFHFGKQK